jgi:hypothetical protein
LLKKGGDADFFEVWLKPVNIAEAQNFDDNIKVRVVPDFCIEIIYLEQQDVVKPFVAARQEGAVFPDDIRLVGFRKLVENGTGHDGFHFVYRITRGLYYKTKQRFSSIEYAFF